MRALIVHGEATYFAGAERMLDYLVAAPFGEANAVRLALGEGSKLAGLLPSQVPQYSILSGDEFRLGTIWKAARQIQEIRADYPFDVLHGWAARDWEVTALAGRWCRCPTVVTLHDHPRASFISNKRRRLMRLASLGLDRIVCVSNAVHRACVEAGYPARKLVTIQNGLPLGGLPPRRVRTGGFRFGFLGALSERKGLRDLFKMVECFAAHTSVDWELAMAGGAQDESGRKLEAAIRSEYGKLAWWPRVHWLGWVEKPLEFLADLDLLICPSAEFDPFPTVLLEAGSVGVPVLAAEVGGVPEIVVDGKTGWLFQQRAWQEGGALIRRLSEQRDACRAAGERASQRVREVFTVERMRNQYAAVYSNLARGGSVLPC